MSATGIGAAVRRKEDRRFITGRGHYTDDVSRPGQVFAYFVRSPHAHAKIGKIDAKAAAALPGVLDTRRAQEQATVALREASAVGYPHPQPALDVASETNRCGQCHRRPDEVARHE